MQLTLTIAAQSISRLTISLFLLLLLCCATRGSVASTKPVQITVHNAAVAADDGICSEIGAKVLKNGGNAVDASVATSLCLGVVSPAASGIGGGSFMMVRLANGNVHAIDMRETAPIDARMNMFDGNEALKTKGPLSIAVPGQLAGLYKAWKTFGRRPWKELVTPAARLAAGFVISKSVYSDMQMVGSDILADPGLGKVFAPNGTLLKPGQICHNPNLSKTLYSIAKNGVEVFYNGSIGRNLVNDIQKAGGIIQNEDLENYEVKLRKPIVANVSGLTLIGMPPPASGTASMVLILNILSHYKFSVGATPLLQVHRQIEAFKSAFAVRMNLGDPDFSDIDAALRDMLSPAFAARLKKNINNRRTFNPRHYGNKWNIVREHGTSHLSIVDQERNAVSITNSINYYFGARFLSPDTGIILNNHMDDFSIPTRPMSGVPPPAPANFIQPFKRPLSSMSPTIILKDGNLAGVIGSSGGALIIGGTTEVLINHFMKKMDPLSSIADPRIYHLLLPNVVQYENQTSPYGEHFEVAANIRAGLRASGHRLTSLNFSSICQFISIQDVGTSKIKSGKLVAASDPRRGGYPVGY